MVPSRDINAFPFPFLSRILVGICEWRDRRMRVSHGSSFLYPLPLALISTQLSLSHHLLSTFIILLSLHSQIPTRILLRKGKGNAVIPRLGTILGQDVCQKHAAVHAFTGCDSVSAFGGQGKIKALNLINKSHE